MSRRTNRNMFWWASLTATYLIFALLLPGNTQSIAQYHLTQQQYHLLLLLISVPVLGIWFAAFYGSAKLHDYADAIKGSREANGFAGLARGADWLAWGQPVLAILSLILSAIGNHLSGFVGASVISTNYLSLVFTLIAFSRIHQGSGELTAVARIHMAATTAKTFQLAFVTLGVVYCYVVFRYTDLHSLSNSQNPFYLPVWLLVTTILIPYLYAWFIGLVAAYDIGLIAKHTKGVLYRQALSLLAIGYGIVITSSIVSQYLRIALPKHGQLLFGVIVLTYLVLLFFAIGFGLIAFGAQRLKKIEDV